MTEEGIEKKLSFVESLFEKNGATPLDINEKNREKFGQRRTFKFGDNFYRVEALKFDEDEHPYMVISCTDDENYARIGIMDDVEALSFDMSEEDLSFLRSEMAPIFQMAYHNLSEEDIQNISNALARTAYLASRQGVNIFDSVQFKVLPLEATKEQDTVAGTKGHLVNYEENEAAIKEFLFAEEDF